MFKRILAVLVARNREFYRDQAGLIWNLVMPILMVLAFAFIFRSGPEDVFKVGVLDDGRGPAASASPFLSLEHIDFVPQPDLGAAIVKVERHQLDLLVDPQGQPAYWVNLNSSKGYLAEKLLMGSYAAAGLADRPQRRTVTGEALRYVDWVLPGVLAMNVMFSSLWGVGWVIVRYRKNGVLRRLKATPLNAWEFLVAQVMSRLLVVLGANAIVFIGASLLLDFPMRGSYLALFSAYVAGTLCLISVGLVVASRLRTEELADGILNLVSWPMMLLSGIWFSMDGTSAAAQWVSRLMPLTHLVDAARKVMIDGAGVAAILPQLSILIALAILLLALAAWLFRWE